MLTAALLTGCSSTYTDHQRDGGISPDTAEQTLEAIDGVSRATYATEEWYSPGEGGLFSSEGMDVYLEVVIDDDHSIADPTAFLDYLARTAWSVNDHYPKGTVTLVITGGIAHYFDWLPVVNEVFDTSLTRVSDFSFSGNYREWGEREVPIAISASTYGEAYGQWPSAEVDVPRGLLLDGAPEYPVVPAISDLSFATYAKEYEEQDCYTLSFTRTPGYEGEYSSVVQTELRARGGAVLQQAELAEGDSTQFYCFDEGERPSGVSLHILAEGSEWYSEVDETLTAD